jgi:hypothetical protein
MMADTRAEYQIWDDDTGNVIAQFGTQHEAVAFLQAMLDANGAGGVRDLAIILYSADGSNPVTLLEGPEFLAQRRIPA